MSVDISPDGKYLAAGDNGFEAKLWHVIENLQHANFFLVGEFVLFSPDGQYLAVWGRNVNSINLWSVGTEIYKTYKMGNINSVSFSPNSKYIATGNSDNTVKLWAIESGQLLKVFTGHHDTVNSVSFSPDGRYLATGSDDNTAKLWTVETGQLSHSFIGHQGKIKKVVFSTNSKFLATGSDDNTIKVWLAETGQPLKTFIGHQGEFKSFVFSLNDHYIVTVGDDNMAKMWEIKKDCVECPIYQYSLSELRAAGLQLEPEDLLQLWEHEEKLTSEELRLIGKEKNKAE